MYGLIDNYVILKCACVCVCKFIKIFWFPDFWFSDFLDLKYSSFVINFNSLEMLMTPQGIEILIKLKVFLHVFRIFPIFRGLYINFHNIAVESRIYIPITALLIKTLFIQRHSLFHATTIDKRLK